MVFTNHALYEDNDSPRESEAENQVHGKTVFMEDSAVTNAGNKEVICPKFLCSMDDKGTCRNEFSTSFGHPCNKCNCMFLGNCYLCDRTSHCDEKGAYLFST